MDELSAPGADVQPDNLQPGVRGGSFYDPVIREQLKGRKSSEDLFFELALEDLAQAADLFRPLYDHTNGIEGWGSAENSAGS